MHEFMDSDRDMTAALEGASSNPFTVRAPGPERDSALVGAGITSRFGRHVSAYVNGDAYFQEDATAYVAWAGIRISF